jgi:hypothetical protein
MAIYLERFASLIIRATNIVIFTRKLLFQWRDVVQADFRSLTTLHREIEEREAKIRRLVDANIFGIFLWDFEGRINSGGQ